MSGHHPHHSHHVSVIHSRPSVIRNQAINDSDNDRSDKLISFSDNNEAMISLSDLSYTDPNDPEWSLPQKRKVLFNHLQRTKVNPHLIGFATLQIFYQKRKAKLYLIKIQDSV